MQFASDELSLCCNLRDDRTRIIPSDLPEQNFGDLKLI